MRNISSHAHKTGSRYLAEVLFNISDEHPQPFNMEVPLRADTCIVQRMSKKAIFRPGGRILGRSMVCTKQLYDGLLACTVEVQIKFDCKDEMLEIKDIKSSSNT